MEAEISLSCPQESTLYPTLIRTFFHEYLKEMDNLEDLDVDRSILLT
jgi:hypothetical protein